MKNIETIDTCNFCGKHKDAVAKLIVADSVAICNECVELCQTLMVDEIAAVTEQPTLDPLAI